MDADLLGDEGLDAGWVISHGANAAWQYAQSVQASLEDLTAARDEGDWALCVESCAMALRAIVYCRRLMRGFNGGLVEPEFQLHLATCEDSAAQALRALPCPLDAGEAEAIASVARVEAEDSALRRKLPFDVPVVRTPEGRWEAMRISATLVRWRRERGLHHVDWRQDGL
ncbi:hypothetical protein ACFS5L_38960 [Streptomyces phyllanthi]|uniref:HEPN domain-containing protein n=1 Tax=Streptomyces phyllanthi TaxID=1803180 RepID=A0A5N8VUK7_9ACTN|nr:hypothetical protein [Streptomyces phyllanthi]MPY38961.1 hypothetical protein [Streptomyces phyllanthi]